MEMEHKRIMVKNKSSIPKFSNRFVKNVGEAIVVRSVIVKY